MGEVNLEYATYEDFLRDLPRLKEIERREDCINVICQGILGGYALAVALYYALGAM